MSSSELFSARTVGQQLGVDEAQALARGLAVAEGRVDGAGHQQRLVLATRISRYSSSFLRVDDELDLAGVVFEA